MNIKRTERGWGGHFICASRCLFRRNTLIEWGRIKIVISTVGNMEPPEPAPKIKGLDMRLIGGLNRYHETMAFRAKKEGIYWDADVSKQIHFDSPWAVRELNATSDQTANDMHEAVVAEIMERIRKGEKI